MPNNETQLPAHLLPPWCTQVPVRAKREYSPTALHTAYLPAVRYLKTFWPLRLRAKLLVKCAGVWPDSELARVVRWGQLLARFTLLRWHYYAND
jgi:hypothetical protein